MNELSHLEQGHFKVMLLNTRKRIIGNITLYIGTLHSNPIRVAEVFRDAIRRNAAAVIVTHNHPRAQSGHRWGGFVLGLAAAADSECKCNALSESVLLYAAVG
jgi:hypothetical protein